MTVVNDEEERNTVIRWLLHVLIALSVGVVAAVVTYSVEIVEHLREVILHFFLTGMPLSVVGYTLGWLFMVLTAIALTACASAVVVFYEPAAAGGGIPDIMAYLNGVHLRRAMNLKTFLAKAASCICAVASGMPVGLEAPLIHLGGITGAGVTQGRSRTLGFQTTWLQSFRSNEDRRDFITAGAACGVSAAFGAPIGGLLFVMEEVSSFWNLVSSGQIFLATMVCFTFITIINSIVEGKSLLGWVTNSASVLFEVNVGIPLNLMSVLPSLLLGAILGGLAALFTKANLVLTRWRRENLKPFPKRRFLEPIVLTGLFTCIMYLLATFSFCRYISSPYTGYSNSIRWGTESADRLFCAMCGEDSNRYSPFGSLSLASGKNVIRHLFTRQTAGEFPLYVLVMYFVLYFVFACLCCGTSVSGGLVVPSLVIGALFGRIFGLVLFYVGSDVNRGGYYSTKYSWMDPGLFALIGAGAFLAGTSRMTMSICVIMVELSSELHYLLPVMVAIVMSKTVADWLSEPLYHHMLHMDCIPYLGPALSHPEFEQLTAADVMATPLTSLRLREKTSVVLDALRNTPHNAFPIYENKTKRGGSVHQ
ncbi:chloride channel protein [Angomonas deanei]|uniref:Voltage gated chloride channel, putative n=1 Tax=Angomonas deanei TaxID=59799 RepID=A0A7G2CMY1_9TRYP|nr:chloride channel protein [Angomonas deanei]CAD2220271.1 Voltage gated chloride channel, putative [Angomonas deanei]|eukprot:EPY20165.1 chloride channel protein [Angomonas deanei]